MSKLSTVVIPADHIVSTKHLVTWAEQNGMPKEHKAIIRAFNEMVCQLVDGADLHHEQNQGFTEVLDARGYVSEIWMDEELATTLTSGWNVRLRRAIVREVKRLRAELEGPKDAAYFARALLASEEEKKMITEQRDAAKKVIALAHDIQASAFMKKHNPVAFASNSDSLNFLRHHGLIEKSPDRRGVPTVKGRKFLECKITETEFGRWSVACVKNTADFNEFIQLQANIDSWLEATSFGPSSASRQRILDNRNPF